MASFSTGSMIGNVVGRIALAAVATVLVGVFSLVGALGSTSEGRALIMVTWFVLYCSFGWALLPAVRFTRTSAAVAAVVWLGGGLFAASFGDMGVRGYSFPAWLSACLMLVVLLVLRPPGYAKAGAVAGPVEDRADD
jgi:hypothetical protein